ncbi:esterase family protein [Fulvivirga sp. M361]|nr:esterase family protein [Fulvivirga sp. M361]
MKIQVIGCFFITLPLTLVAAQVDTVLIQSSSMNKTIRCVVVKPDGYDQNNENRYPAVYLLHGYNGSYSDWIKKAPRIKMLTDRFDVLIICPDGAKNSWYFDSPDDRAMQYETHITKEVISFIDERYNTRKGREGRAITGLSMGGHGAMYLALRHPEWFGAAGSMSGGVDLTPFPGKWEIAHHLGKYGEQPDTWKQHSVINMLHLTAKLKMAFIIDCGTEDFFLKVNRTLHERMLYRNIPHQYTERPGGHNWEYWQEAVDYQLLFFGRFFSQGEFN